MSKTKKKSKDEAPLTLDPTEIVLAGDPTGSKGSFSIRNNLSSPLAYKIKATNPNAFKVKPLHGVLAAKGSVDIQVTLLPGTKCDCREKFLVLTTVTDREHLKSEEIHKIFKDADNPNSHYLPCSILLDEDTGGNMESKRTTAERLEVMEKRIKASMKMQVIILVLVCSLLFLFSNNSKRNYCSFSDLWY